MEKLISSRNAATTKSEITQREILEAIRSFTFTIIFDHIIQEEVMLGVLKIGEIAPFSAICETEHLYKFSLKQYRGKWLDANGIILSADFSCTVRDFFDQEIYNLFAEFNQTKKNFDDNAQYSGRFKQDLETVYMFFMAIIQQKVQYDIFDLIPERILNKEVQRHDEKIIHRFVFEMFHGKFRRGACVHKFISKLNYVPFYVADLLNFVNGKYYVKVDRDSAFMYCALTALFMFKLPDNCELFLRKLKQYEKENKSFFN